MCGEKVVFPLFRSFRLGLPPRMRGKAERAAAAANRRRITPAHAGKSTLVNSTTKPQRDHPRLCGEKAAYFRAECVPRGSPPRVRGKAVQFHHRHNGVGITPACAGKSHVLPRPAQVQWDHPRVCGEKKKAEEMGATTKGSPPRMRGKENRVLGGILHVRITPACAGKRGQCCPDRLRCWDHPRVCGEKMDSSGSAAMM